MLHTTPSPLARLGLVLALVSGGALLAQRSPRPTRSDRPLSPMAEPPRGLSRPERPQSAMPAPTARPATPYPSASRQVLPPRPLPRLSRCPTQDDWRHRDLFEELKVMARRGRIEVTPVAEDAGELKGVTQFPAGWAAYGFQVPPGGKLHVRLHHVNEGWFRLQMVNKWGSLEEGMLRNLIQTGNPEVTYTNPTKEGRSVYVIVDDPGWMSSKADPFTLKVTRDWEPGKRKLNDAPIVTGIWAQKEADPKAEKETKG